MRIVQTQRDGWQIVAADDGRRAGLLCPHCGARRTMMWYQPGEGRLLCGTCRFGVGDA